MLRRATLHRSLAVAVALLLAPRAAFAAPPAATAAPVSPIPPPGPAVPPAPNAPPAVAPAPPQAPADALTIDRAVQLVLTRNERARISDLNVTVADAAVEKPRAGFLPVLAFNEIGRAHV